MARARKVVEIFTLENRPFFEPPLLSIFIIRSWRHPSGTCSTPASCGDQSGPSVQKDRPNKKKKTEKKGQKKGGRSNEKENEEEEEELERGKKKKAQREGSKDDEQREPGYGSWGPNRKRGKSTGKYVVDSAERRPKAKWNSVRWFSGRSSETAGRHHCLRARFFSPHRVVPPSSLSTVSFLEPYSLRRSSPDHRLQTRRRRRSRRIRREEIAKMQSATVRTRVRADSAAETVRLGLKGRLHLHSIYREDFFRPFFFFAFSFSFFLRSLFFVPYADVFLLFVPLRTDPR